MFSSVWGLQMNEKQLERAALTPESIVAEGFNPDTELPYDWATEHLQLAMNDFVGLLGFIK